MLIGERMSHPVITIQPNMSVPDAINLMKQEKIRRFPVVDQGKLVGIVSEKDLIHASASSVTSLSIWELNYLLSNIAVKDVMTKDVITVEDTTTIETAARIMADNKIGGLPVMRNKRLVGIITETDLFKLFLELLGAREAGVRITSLVQNKPGVLAEMTSAIAKSGGDINALGIFLGEDATNREVTVKVSGVSEEQLKNVVEPLVERIMDIRTHD